MNYEEILKEIKPTKAEIKKVHKIATDAIDYINQKAIEEDIKAEAILVGSVAKDTWLSGNGDIDIFINFPLNTDEKYLKEKGLYLGYKCSEHMNGIAEEHYASHPYLTSKINSYSVDFVPCYKIKDANELKSAVDRTILHTKYIQKHLKENQKDEVLLLKKFTSEVGTYGSEFKTGGFAGYLCEILILKYGSFKNTLIAASNWKKKTEIDLEDYGTAQMFKDPLIAIDPTDENRNVAAALRKEKMAEFVIASRNFLKDENTALNSYFNTMKNENKSLNSYLTRTKIKNKVQDILNQFKDRETKTIALKFKIPDAPSDAIHPQLRKTEQSIKEKLEDKDFSVFKSDYWCDEDKIAIFIFELNVYKQSRYKIQEGPRVWDKKASDNFIAKHEDDYYIIDDLLVLNRKRQFKTAQEFIEHVLTEEHIHIIRVGKNLKDLLIDSYELSDINELIRNDSYLKKNNSYFTDFLNFLDDFLNPGQLIRI